MNKKRIIAFILVVLMILGLTDLGFHGNYIKADKTTENIKLPAASVSVRDDGTYATTTVKVVQNALYDINAELSEPSGVTLPDENWTTVGQGWYDFAKWQSVTGGTYVNVTDNPDKGIDSLGVAKTVVTLADGSLAIYVVQVQDNTIPEDPVIYLFPALCVAGAIDSEPTGADLTPPGTDYKFTVTPETGYTDPTSVTTSGNDLYVGGYKYLVTPENYEESTLNEELKWDTAANTVAEVNNNVGVISYDGEYYLYKAYYINGKYVFGRKVTSRERYSTPPKVKSTSVTGNPVAASLSGSWDESTLTYTVTGACANQDLSCNFTFENGVKIGGTEYAAGATYSLPIPKSEAKDGQTIPKSFEVKSSEYTDKEPPITVNVSVTYIDTTPVVGFNYDSSVWTKVNDKWFTNIKNPTISVNATVPSPATISSVTLNTETMTKDGSNWTKSVNLESDKENTLTAEATSDTAKTGTATEKLILDDKNPIVNEFKITQKDPKDGSEKSEVIPAKKNQSMKVTATAVFALDLKFNDPGSFPSGVKKLTVLRDKEAVVDGVDVTGKDSYSFNEDLRSVKENYYGKKIEYTVNVEDALGNFVSYIYYVKIADEKIDARVDIYKDKACTTGVSDGYLTSNKVLYLKYTVNTYDVELADWSISDTTHAKLISNTSIGHVYTLIYEFKTNASGDFTDIVATFTNEDNISKKAEVKSLKFDLSNPTIILPEDNEWYTTLLLSIVFPENYNDNPAGSDEGTWKSGIKSATVTMSNCKDTDPIRIFIDDKLDPGKPQKDRSYQLTVSPSLNYQGTTITLKAIDKAGRSTTASTVRYVDDKAPTGALSVNEMTPLVVMGKVLSGNPIVKYELADNIQLNKYTLKVTAPDGKEYKDVINYSAESGGILTSDASSIALSGLLGRNPEDGTYILELSAVDNAGTGIDHAITTSFILDNTKPVIEAKITTKDPAKISKNNHRAYDGTVYGAYYAENVTFSIKLIENNIDKISVTDNGISVNNISWSDGAEGGSKIKTASVTISNEGSHTVKIGLLDKAGVSADERSFTFIIDKTAPQLRMSLNGSGVGNGTTGIQLTTPASVGISVIDANKDTQDLTRRTVIAYPGGGNSDLSVNIPEGVTLMEAEGDYTVSFKAVDLAGNSSETYTMAFRVDTAAPEVSITGIPGGGASRSDVNVTFTIKDSFYWDLTSAKATIYKAIDGSAERVFEDLSLTPNSAQYSISRLINEDGEYRMTLAATDKVGHSADTSATFILDGTAPLIELLGVKNYDSTDKDVTLNIKVTEAFFKTNSLKITGTRTDIDGKKTDVKFSSYSVNSSSVSNIKQLFKEDGIYDLDIVSQDKAGNRDEKKLHFTIDKTAPELTKDLTDIDGVSMNSFTWNYKIDEIVRDLTVCQVSVYVDGTEYDGVSKLANGSHVLKIVAEDELGHKTEKTINLVIDDITPTILITGVEKGANLSKATTVNVSVQLDEDKLDSVELNGKQIDVVDNAATIEITNRGSYRLMVTASDAAGNLSTEDMTFSYGSGTKGLIMWIAIIGGAVLLVLAVLLILIRRGKKQ